MKRSLLLERVGQQMLVAPAASDTVMGEVAAWCGISVADVAGNPKTEDLAVLASLVTDVQEALEGYTGRVLSPSRVRLTLDLEDIELGDGTVRTEIHLVGGDGQCVPLILVESLTTYDVDDVATVMPAADYLVLPSASGGRIALRDGVDWPSSLRTQACVVVDLLCGHGPRAVTLTLASVAAGTTVEVNGLTFTAHATTTTPANREFAVNGTDAQDAAALLTCLTDATYGVTGIRATAASAVVTLTVYGATALAVEASATSIAVAHTQHGVPGIVRLTAKEAITYWYRNPGVGVVANALTGGSAVVPPHIGLLLARLAACGFVRPPEAG